MGLDSTICFRKCAASRCEISGLRFVITLLMMAWFLGLCANNSVMAQQGPGREALMEKNYPWFDAQSGQVRRIEMNDRPKIKSANRNSIPLRPVKKKAANPKKTNRGNWGQLISGLSVFAWTMIAILILVIAGFLAWAILRLEQNVAADDESAGLRSMEESIKQLPFELESGSEDFRKAAGASYLAGDYRRAIIYLFSHVLVSLDQKGHIRLRKGKTNRQYLRELRPYRPLANFYQRVMVPFEATFFGNHEPGKKEFEDCWNQLDDFQMEVNQTSQVAHG